MKKLIYFLLITGVFYSCSLDRDPFTDIETEELFEDPGGIESAMNGNYSLMKGAVGHSGIADQLHRIAEYAGDNITLSGGTSDDLIRFYNYKAIPNNWRIASVWRDGYRAIAGTNTIIDRIEEGLSADEDQLLGEAYYLRALIHFQLGNVFGRPFNQGAGNLSVPLKITADPEDLPPRNTVGEVYDQVIADLLKAESLMNVQKEPIFATKGAAQALLSRVYLYQEDNVKAVEYADKVINSGTYSLLPTDQFAVMNTLNPLNNSEMIFAIGVDGNADLQPGGSGFDEHFGTIGSFYARVDGVGWGEMYASSVYLDLIDQNPGDARRTYIQEQYEEDENGSRIPSVYWVNEISEGEQVYVQAPTTTSGSTTTFNFEGTTYELQSEDVGGRTQYFFDGPNGRQDVVFDFLIQNRNGYPNFFIFKVSLQDGDRHLHSPTISRLGEIYLNKAEALAKLGNEQGALDNVNIIRERAGIPTFSSATIPSGMSVLDVVLQERQLELAFEGHRRFDIFRNGRTLDRRYPGRHLEEASAFLFVGPDNLRVVELLPEEQLLLQPDLVPNP